MLQKNLSRIAYESCFVPVDVTTNITLLCCTILVAIFFLVILFDKTCRAIPMLLGNSIRSANVLNESVQTHQRLLSDRIRRFLLCISRIQAFYCYTKGVYAAGLTFHIAVWLFSSTLLGRYHLCGSLSIFCFSFTRHGYLHRTSKDNDNSNVKINLSFRTVKS